MINYLICMISIICVLGISDLNEHMCFNNIYNYGKKIEQRRKLEVILYQDKSDTLKIEINKNNIVGEDYGFDDSSGYILPKFLCNNKLLYFDSSDLSSYFIDAKSFICVPICKNLIYLLIKKYDPINGNKFRIFKYYNNRLVFVMNVPLSFYGDLDNDGFFEIGGGGVSEAINDSTFFSHGKFQIYELNKNIIIDSAATEKYQEFNPDNY